MLISRHTLYSTENGFVLKTFNCTSPLIDFFFSFNGGSILKQSNKQAGPELGQAQVRLDDIVEVVIEVVVKAVVKVEV